MKSQRITLHIKDITATISLDHLTEHYGHLAEAVILGGHQGDFPHHRFSYWLARPREILCCPGGSTDCLRRLTEAIAHYFLPDSPEVEGMFVGGWAGALSYDLGRAIERLPSLARDDLEMPWLRLGFYDRVLAYDHHHRRFRLAVLTWPGDEQSVSEKFAWLHRQLDQAAGLAVAPWSLADMEAVDPACLQSNLTRDEYLRRIARVKHYILEGETYQINLSQRFSHAFYTDPVHLFHWQNAFNPSPFAAYLKWPDHAIVSASPEMFLTLSDGHISTQPIKGTRPRRRELTQDDVTFNRRQQLELQRSLKEQAELNMIVDLERNDLARICEPGTRRVEQPRSLEAFSTVYHAVATIGGILRDGVGWDDILRAVFPGGSITGAPKIRSMEIIESLEPTRRGVYTGSIGFIGVDGNACLNIAIRTIIITGHRAYAQAGGGIVADSDPAAEYEETLTKARALLAGIQAVQKTELLDTSQRGEPRSER